MEPSKNNNPFLDTILGKFSTRVGVVDCINTVKWDERSKTALILLRPPDPEQFEDMKGLVAEMLREIDHVRFKAAAKWLREGNNYVLVLKLKEES